MILGALWFFLPAGLANAVPVIGPKLPLIKNFSVPLDFGKTWRQKRIFGANKTWRGLFMGIIVSTIIIALQKYLFTRNLFFLELSWIDYRPLSIWFLGPLFGIGALGADAIESFFKRQKGVEPGKAWFPFDQTDYIVGGLLLSAFVVRLPAGKYILVLAVWFCMHIFASYVAYLFGLKKQPI